VTADIRPAAAHPQYLVAASGTVPARHISPSLAVRDAAAAMAAAAAAAAAAVNNR